LDETVANPDWATVDGFFDRLTELYTMTLIGPNQSVMTVVGGADQFYVSVIGDHMGPYDLIGPDSSNTGLTNMVLGGVKSEIPLRFLTTREQAHQAMEYFCRHNSIDPTLNWQLC
jgi:hypothetical protein